MIVLGMHFGHDASLCVLRDGIVAASLIKERRVRIRHSIGLDYSDVEAVLGAAGIGPDDVDFCSLASTQDIEYLFFDPRLLSFETGGDHPRALESPWFDRLKAGGGSPPGLTRLADLFSRGEDHHYRTLLRQYADRDITRVPSSPSIEDFAFAPVWGRSRTLAEIASTDYSGLLTGEIARSFHIPATVTLAGRKVPGALFSHHYAHAAYAFYQSPFDAAAVLSHDGGSTRRGYRAGMFYHGEGTTLYPLTPHYLPLGWIYYTVGVALGLGAINCEGKLMGLAAYGRPRFDRRPFLGNWFDGPRPGELKHPNVWIEHCLQSARDLGEDVGAFGDRDCATASINADLAASTQAIFEDGLLLAVESLAGALKSSGVRPASLCLAGGTALNCPANAKVSRQGMFDRLFVPPGCDDSGLAIGSAYALYHGLLGHPRLPAGTLSDAGRVFLGRQYGEDDIRGALDLHRETLVGEDLEDPANEAATLLHQGKIIGWFQGRSELGPRALGHRSILAAPAPLQVWERVNRIKQRELWRPLAPAVLEDEARNWFAGIPLPSPFMLFTAEVRSDAIPGVTHVDGTARVQTVSPENGPFFHLIQIYHRLSGTPLVLNTSFNGPGEPIVETPDDAMRCLETLDLDALIIGRQKVRRRAPGLSP